MKRSVKWMLGLGVLLVAMLAAVFWYDTASAQFGPGGRWSQATPGTAQANPGPGSGCCANAGTQTGSGLGMMNGYGRGAGMRGPGVGVPVATGPLSDQTKQFLTEAIQDEYQARALYQAIVDKFGQVLPFTNIARSENTHVAALVRLFNNHGLSVPEDTFAGKVEAPATLADAFKVAIQFEKDDAAMYTRFLETVKEQDVVQVFTHLENASTNMHLKALEYYNQ